MSWDTVRRFLRQLGASYRRARRVPGVGADPKGQAWLQSVMKRALQKVRALARLGVCDLFFGDESGFCLAPSVPYLWQKKGQTVEFVAQGHQKRFNVLGFWKEAAQEEQSLLFRGHTHTLTSQEFIAGVEEQLLPALRRPGVLVLDNARLHRCAAVQHKQKQWKAQGLRLWFLPPYSPHLNRIEVVWRCTKHNWLEPEDYNSFPDLCQGVANVLNQVGTTYAVSFA